MGLDAAGKTTILCKLKLGPDVVVATNPTIGNSFFVCTTSNKVVGFNVEYVHKLFSLPTFLQNRGI